MSIMSAIKFFRAIEADDNLRETLEQAKDRDKRAGILQEANLQFDDVEIDEAYNSLLRRCQFEYQALYLNEIYIWWKILNE